MNTNQNTLPFGSLRESTDGLQIYTIDGWVKSTPLNTPAFGSLRESADGNYIEVYTVNGWITVTVLSNEKA